MKRHSGVLIALIIISGVTHAQNEDIYKASIIRINDGDSIYIDSEYEIDLHKKRVCIVNPTMDYLEIKGGKPKYKVTKTKWDKIEALISEINLSDYNKIAFDYKSYSITLFFADKKSKTFTTQIEKELIRIKEILKVIREE